MRKILIKRKVIMLLLITMTVCCDAATLLLSDKHSDIQIKNAAVQGVPKTNSIQASINGHVLSVVFLENLGQVAVEVTTANGDEILENYEEAVAWYEDVLTDPETGFNDSIFAAIDLGELYLRMEVNGTKGVSGKLKQYVPESMMAHQQQTELALSLLPKGVTTNNIEQKHRELPEQLWTDIVTEQPDSYVVDENGDIHIHSAEGLAWLSVLSNGLHGQEVDDFNQKTVYLEEDIDLSGYAWNPIGASFSNPEVGEIHYYFKGVFEGNGHQIDNLILSEGFQIIHSGLFGNVTDGEIHGILIENCIVNQLPSLLAYDLSGNSLAKNVVVHCLSFKAEQGTMFTAIREGSTVENCIIHYDYKKEEFYGSGFSTYNQGTILNCASIIDTLYWSWGGCSGLVYDNWGQINNCYSYWGELEDFPYYGGGLAPRNGVCEGNGGVVENCYYNRMPQELGFDDGPGEGDFQNVSSFYNTADGWRLTTPITISGAAPENLVDVLNLWVESQSNSSDYLKWCIDTTGGHHELPVFVDFGFNSIDESVLQISVQPNPTIGVFTVAGENLKHIEVFDVLGQRVTALQAAGDRTAIDLSNQPVGIYFVSVTDTEGRKCVKKVVKQ